MCVLVTSTVIYADFEPLAALAKLDTGDKCSQIIYEILIIGKDIGTSGGLIDVFFFFFKEKEEFNILSGNFYVFIRRLIYV